MFEWDMPPQFVNEKGCKFWLDKDTTEYAVSKGLKDIQVLYVEESNGSRTRLIVQNGNPIYEHQSLESIGCRIDIIAVMQLYDENDKEHDVTK